MVTTALTNTILQRFFCFLVNIKTTLQLSLLFHYYNKSIYNANVFLEKLFGKKKTTQGMKNEALLIANKHNNGMSGVIYSLSFFSRRLTTHPLSKEQCGCSTKCTDVT